MVLLAFMNAALGILVLMRAVLLRRGEGCATTVATPRRAKKGYLVYMSRG